MPSTIQTADHHVSALQILLFSNWTNLPLNIALYLCASYNASRHRRRHGRGWIASRPSEPVPCRELGFSSWTKSRESDGFDMLAGLVVGGWDVNCAERQKTMYRLGWSRGGRRQSHGARVCPGKISRPSSTKDYGCLTPQVQKGTTRGRVRLVSTLRDRLPAINQRSEIQWLQIRDPHFGFIAAELAIAERGRVIDSTARWSLSYIMLMSCRDGLDGFNVRSDGTWFHLWGWRWVPI